jgi:ribosomal protein S18 acetylase RimI-like enzyme
MEIRRVQPDERETLGRITVEAYRDLERVASLGPYENALRDVTGRDLDSEVYVALDDDGAIVGGVTYVPDAERSMSEFDDDEAGGIRMLAVDPTRQGRGVGRSLVETCLARAREHDRRRVILHSTPIMVTAQALYQKLGFLPAPELDVWFSGEPYSTSEPLHLVAFVLTL